MKTTILTVFLITPLCAFAQFGVNMHYSSLPFAGVFYEFNERIKPEFRIGTNTYLDDLSVEGLIAYDFYNSDDVEFYAGFGFRTNRYSGIVVPIGLAIYPFAVNKFGFHMELAPIFGEEDILRGSLGIRYRFIKRE